MTREEALNIFLGDLHNNRSINTEAARLVADGLLEILCSNHRKALEAFGLNPFEKGKALEDFLPKWPVGRPRLGPFGKGYKEVSTREEKYRPIHDEILKRYCERKNKSVKTDPTIIRAVAKDFDVSYSYAKKAYYSVKSCYTK